MKWIRSFAIFLCIVCTQSLCAANPDDIDFRLRFTKDPPVYHVGESIEFEISYSAQTDAKYQISLVNPMPELSIVTLRLTPATGFVDIQELRRGYASGGSIFSSGPVYLASQPIPQQADMSAWYRFQTPGHYSLVVTSNAVWFQKSAAEGGGQSHLALESNAAQFEILPADPAWQEQELRDVTGTLEATSDSSETYRALYRLGLLETPASVRKLVELYLSRPNPEWGYAYYLTLSSKLDLIIPSLRNVLTDSRMIPPAGLAELLADLQVRERLGVIPVYPDDPVKQREWQAQFETRAKVRDEYLARANALLLESIGHRLGSQRSSAIYEVWSNAERQNATNPMTSDKLAQLRAAVLAVINELSPPQQTQFILLAWQSIPHEQFLPTIRNLSRGADKEAASYRNAAFKLWCEDWLGDCSAEILSDALKSETQIAPPIILLMSEAEHPELDSLLEERIKNSGSFQDTSENVRTAALILRAGSRNLLPFFGAALNESAVQAGNNCQVKAYWLGYLFRFSREDAERQLSEELWGRGKCGSEFLRIVNTVRYSDDLIPVAVKALDSPHLDVAGTAALFLGEHGRPGVQDALWRRLEALWNARHDEAEELRVVPLEGGYRNQTTNLEQSLASALAHAKNWQLTPGELERLRAGCLTEQCQNIADGKMYLGL